MSNKRKSTQAELAEEKLLAQKARNAQTRTRALIAWNEAASSADKGTRVNAQARLFL